jgi:hypothetical protein
MVLRVAREPRPEIDAAVRPREDVEIVPTTPFVPKRRPFKDPTDSEFTESIVAEVVASVVVALNVCIPLQMFACARLREATTAPVIGLMVSVPSTFET